ncbi:MAG TPA: BamA/TamA family outer membrane protein [Gemmatimonadales bacterium]
MIAIALAALMGPAHRAWSQSPYTDIRSSAEVGSIGFRFRGTESFSPAELGGVLGLKGRKSLYKVRQIAAALPLIGPPPKYRFDPVELQKDVVRLTRFYQRSGFLHPAVDYELRPDDQGYVVDVTFVISEGPFVRLRDLWVATRAGQAVAPLPDSLQPAWTKLESELGKARGQRFGENEAALMEETARAWFHNHGYPFAKVQAARQVDSNQVDVTLRMEPGRRQRVGQVTVNGQRSVSDRIILRELPFRPGDWYSAQDLVEGRQRLQQIDLFRQAQLNLDLKQPTDTLVGVRVEVLEGGPRLTLAELGYISEGAGISGRAQWTHPNFTGGARSLTATLEGQSGIGSVASQEEKLLRGSLTLTQPYIHVPQLSLGIGPFSEYRDDLRDRSVSVGISGIFLYRLANLSTIALEYRYEASHIYEYRFGTSSDGTISLARLLASNNPALQDSLGQDLDKSSVTLTGSFGKADDLANPRKGWSLRPRAEITVPSGITTVQFGRLDLTVAGYHPISRKATLAARMSIGRLFPFGKSVPLPGDSPVFSLIRLRDETMTAGGTDDVRGWGSRLLGPKFPAVEAHIEGSDTVLSADSYVPAGMLARLAGTVELRFPFPGLTNAWGAQLFMDMGKVWTPDAQFKLPVLEGETELRFSLGTGISYQTPVGAIRLGLGYKVNPSDLDVRDAGEVLAALEQGLPATTVETDWLRRLHLHLSFGMTL